MTARHVPLLAGTDGLYDSGGTELVHELELFVKAGLTPMQALESATSKPARFLGLQKTLGTIEVGKEADLVLLTANPLEGIANVRKVKGVVLRGRYYAASEFLPPPK